MTRLFTVFLSFVVTISHLMATEEEGTEDQKPKVVYATGPAEKSTGFNPWPTKTDPYFIAELGYRDPDTKEVIPVVITVNTTDMRCARIGISLPHKAGVYESNNRQPTATEIMAMSHATSLMSMVYRNMGLIPQSCHHGNNSIDRDPATGKMRIGATETQVNIYHLWGQYPYREYELNGIHVPMIPFGSFFDTTGRCSDQKKVPWDMENVEKMSRSLADRLQETHAQELMAKLNLSVKETRSKVPAISFYKGSYAPTHWSMTPATVDDPNHIAQFTVDGVDVSVILNPTDMRRYRMLILLDDKEHPERFFNREPKPEEESIIATVRTFMETLIFQKLGYPTGWDIAGNNSFKVMPDEARASLGHPGEPNMAGHTHLWIYGLPENEPFSGVPLYGPAPGKLFDLKGPKVPWDPAKQMIVRDGLRNLINQNTHLFPGKFNAQSALITGLGALKKVVK